MAYKQELWNLQTDDDWKGNSGNGKGNGNNKKNSKSDGTDDAGYGNATNAEENNSQNPGKEKTTN